MIAKIFPTSRVEINFFLFSFQMISLSLGKCDFPHFQINGKMIIKTNIPPNQTFHSERIYSTDGKNNEENVQVLISNQ
jgi:hypothetical protein